MNEAIPSGKETSIELDVHREQGPRGSWRVGVGWRRECEHSWRSTEESSRGPRTDAHFPHPVNIPWFYQWALRVVKSHRLRVGQFPDLNQYVALRDDLISLSLSFQFYICAENKIQAYNPLSKIPN